MISDADRLPVTVLHLDHTDEPGGAELALRRLVDAESPMWSALLVLPTASSNAHGAFDQPSFPGSFELQRRGPAQESGASKSSSALRKLQFIASGLGQAIALRSSRQFQRADIIHANTSRSAIYGALACLGSRRRFVVHLRDMITIDSLGRLGHTLFTRTALRRADGVIANSTATLASAEPYLRPSTHRSVIPSPIGIAVHRAPVPAMEAARAQPQTVGMVARIDRWKGHELLLEAFARAFADSDVRLRLAGGSQFGNEDYLLSLQELSTSLGIRNRVDFLGHIDNVEEFISSVDICVQSSIRPEPLGQNILQYLSLGKPTIAVNAGGPSEWITDGHNGLLFTLGDVESLADALRRLSTDSELRTTLASNASPSVAAVTDAGIRRAHADAFSRTLSPTSDRSGATVSA